MLYYVPESPHYVPESLHCHIYLHDLVHAKGHTLKFSTMFDPNKTYILEYLATENKATIGFDACPTFLLHKHVVQAISPLTSWH